VSGAVEVAGGEGGPVQEATSLPPSIPFPHLMRCLYFLEVSHLVRGNGGRWDGARTVVFRAKRRDKQALTWWVCSKPGRTRQGVPRETTELSAGRWRLGLLQQPSLGLEMWDVGCELTTY
jgi:hypothetical protein